jgi:hypothetical protein
LLMSTLGGCNANGRQGRLGSAFGVGIPRGFLTKNEFVSLNEGRELGKQWEQCLDDTELGVEVADQLMD